MRSLLLAVVLAALAAATAVAGEVVSTEPDGSTEPSIARHARGDSIPYVIVTTRELRPEFLRLARAHTRAGLRAGVWTLESIRCGYPVARDDAERIRMFLQDVHRERGARWLLLGGDVSQIPIRLATLHTGIFEPPGAGYRVPTDQYYACLDGTWNADGDDDWGESATDDVDLIPELIVGRAPVGTPWEARQFVGRTIDALDHDEHDASVLLAAEVFGPSIDAAAYAEQLRPLFEAVPETHVARLYENAAAWPGAATETRQALIDSLNHGYDLAVLYGAADQTRLNAGVDTPPTELFTVDDAASLRTERATTVYFATVLTCSLSTTPCLGEAMINARAGDVVAVVGATCRVFLGQVQQFALRFFEASTHHGAATHGEALTDAIVEFFGSQGSLDIARLAGQGTILLGDPALPMRPGSPPQTIVQDPVAPPSLAADTGARDAVPTLSLVRRASAGTARFDLAIPPSLAGTPCEIAAFDAAGRRVRTIDRETAAPGTRTFEWDLKNDAGTRVASGVYFLSVRAGGQMVSRRVTIVE